MFIGRKNSMLQPSADNKAFMSQQTKWTFNIFFNVNCKVESIIYLMECILCQMQYVGREEAAFNLRLITTGKTPRNLTPF